MTERFYDVTVWESNIYRVVAGSAEEAEEIVFDDVRTQEPNFDHHTAPFGGEVSSVIIEEVDDDNDNLAYRRAELGDDQG